MHADVCLDFRLLQLLSLRHQSHLKPPFCLVALSSLVLLARSLNAIRTLTFYAARLQIVVHCIIDIT